MKQSGRIRRTKAPYTRLFRDSESLRLFDMSPLCNASARCPGVQVIRTAGLGLMQAVSLNNY